MFPRETLQSDNELANTVKNLLSLKQAGKLVGKTTITAYRRVHEIIASTLDRIVDAAKSKASEEEFSKLMIELTRCLILVRYQHARNQISRNLADSLTYIITTVMDNIAPKNRDPRKLEQIASRARTLLDALAVLVYQAGVR